VTANLEVDGEQLVLRITDNGIGLPHEHRHRLTEPYVTTRVKGTGLGLAIVRKIVEDHGGEIVLSDAGEYESGAEVHIRLPLRRKPQREAQKQGVGNEQERILDRA
jgi:two-component system nitrogen regulation sensor histidine kinase NtrY